MIKRRSIIVYYKNPQILDNIINAQEKENAMINVAYKSQKRKYAVLYLDENKLKALKNILFKTKGITEVIDSKFDLETF